MYIVQYQPFMSHPILEINQTTKLQQVPGTVAAPLALGSPLHRLWQLL